MFMETIRTFVAIEIPDAVKNQVEVLENQFKKIRTDIKWVHPQNIHIALKFLGNTSINRLEEIYDGLQEAVDSIRPFQLKLQQVGAFPDLKRPRVFWINIDQGREALMTLQKRIEEILYARRFVREERPFSPHLTIGRVRSPRGLRTLTDQVRSITFNAQAFTVDRVVVVKSDLQSTGPIYTVLNHTNLV
jgi:2'-5' RNA ligase